MLKISIHHADINLATDFLFFQIRPNIFEKNQNYGIFGEKFTFSPKLSLHFRLQLLKSTSVPCHILLGNEKNVSFHLISKTPFRWMKPKVIGSYTFNALAMDDKLA